MVLFLGFFFVFWGIFLFFFCFFLFFFVFFFFLGLGIYLGNNMTFFGDMGYCFSVGVGYFFFDDFFCDSCSCMKKTYKNNNRFGNKTKKEVAFRAEKSRRYFYHGIYM